MNEKYVHISIEIDCIRFYARLILFLNIGGFLFRCPFFGWLYTQSFIMVDDKMEFFGRFFMVLDILQFYFMTCHWVLDPKQMVRSIGKQWMLNPCKNSKSQWHCTEHKLYSWISLRGVDFHGENLLLSTLFNGSWQTIWSFKFISIESIHFPLTSMISV